MHLLENVSLMTSNLQYGIVTRSFPLTGKILKGHLDASGTTNGLGIGNPNEEFSPNVSCVALSSCGGTGRIVWGFRNGDVAVTSAARVMDSNRPAARFKRCHVDDGHAGDVRCVIFTGREDELIVSGCSHGQVKLWDARHMRCLWTGLGQREDSLLFDPCVKVAYSVGANTLVASLQGGDIMLWWGFQLPDDGIGSQTMIGAVQALRVAQPAHSTSSGVNPAESLYVDPGSSPSKIKVLVHYAHESHFLRLVVDLPTRMVTFTQFCGGPLGPLTNVRPCFVVQHDDHGSTPVPTPVDPGTSSLSINNAGNMDVPRESSFVLAGDTLGRMCLWNWNAEGHVAIPEQPEDPPKITGAMAQVSSSRRWEAHDDGAVCAIELDNVVIITGSSRGTLKVWDSLTFAPLRSFPSPANKPNLTGQWDPVGQIILRGDLLVASVGSRILVWQAGAVVADKKGKAKLSAKPKGRGSGNTLNKWQQQVELNRDIRESKSLLDDERAHAQRVYGRARAQRSTLDQLGLSEAEAIEYVLMLSREEADQRHASMLQSVPPHTRTPMDMVATVPSDADGVFILDDDSELAQPQPDAQTPYSPKLCSASNTSSPRHDNLADFASRSMPSPSNSNMPVMPMCLPQRAGFSSVPIGISAARSPTRGRSETSLSTPTTCSSLDDPEVFPPIMGAPSRSASSRQLSGSWSRGSPSGSLLSADHAGNVVAGHISNSSPAASSSVPRNLSQTSHKPRNRAEEEDDELKFILELSLAEARSRGEQ
ncbi:WD40-repeat-containing domain protein [Gautieria morchelliformis]|nr:WD40-repeat-containing domain protein [Gautieria morchelliformis]